ncbi:MAG: ABC transporter permease [Clostridiaceae bacterium]|nr:ABC transporter permease [Clostridiaceae bacterium]
MNIVNKVTLKTLSKNKVRTFVTIIGIILSVSMITAVTTGISSLQNFLVNIEIEQSGDWYGAAYSISNQKLKEVENSNEVSQITSLQNIGYSLLEDSNNEYKPYLFIGGMDTDFAEIMPVDLIEGRLPTNTSEIILPEHIKFNGGVVSSIGDTLKLKIGDRISGDSPLNQFNPFIHQESGMTEDLVIKEERTYTVVGFYKRPGFESYSAPGYTALTMADDKDSYSFDAYLKVTKAKDIYSFMEQTFPEGGYNINQSLLRYTGSSNERSFNSVLYSLAAVLIVIIMFGSISLIYNAFSISVSERTKQFGLLSSIGATRQQMKKSVLFEAFFLSIIGIPLGLLAGILGIGLTFNFVDDIFASLLGEGINTALSLYVSWEAAVAAMVIGLITVMISAYIPARRAFKVSAIDAIRMSKDINIKAKKLRTSKLSYNLFGVEGMIAKKNFKRSRKRYRSTVISLFLSVVLFISASSFSAYLTKGVTTVVDEASFDIRYVFDLGIDNKAPLEDVYNELKNIAGVTDSSYSVVYNPYYSKIATVNLSQEYKDYIQKTDEIDLTQTDYEFFDIEHCFINDDAYLAYLEKNSLDYETILGSPEPIGIVVDYARIYNNDEGRYYTINQIDRSNKTIKAMFVDEIEGYYLSGASENANKELIYEFRNENEEGKVIIKTQEEAERHENIEIGAVLSDLPMGASVSGRGQIKLVYPYSTIEAVLGENYTQSTVFMYFKADNHKAVFEKMYKALDDRGLSNTELFDFADMGESEKALITVINIFSYGFIVLISLIAAANVFNTISTNIGLRRREFAMLKSIGMTQKMFNRMMNYECLLYGIKGLAYGIPVSIGVTWLIYKSIIFGLETKFFIPWYSLVIAVGSVFAVVFATMIYSMRKIKKDNPIDALKDENL